MKKSPVSTIFPSARQTFVYSFEFSCIYIAPSHNNWKLEIKTRAYNGSRISVTNM